MRHAKLMALGVDERQCQGNLLWRPALSLQVLHEVKQDGVGCSLRTERLCMRRC